MLLNDLEKGWVKPLEDSVVISREEYERLKHYEWRVTSGVCMTQKEWFDFCNEDSNRRTCLRIEEREKERKETAEKYKVAMMLSIQEMQKYLELNEEQAKILYHHNNEIAKQFDVGVKE
jgi:hypothetical protein